MEGRRVDYTPSTYSELAGAGMSNPTGANSSPPTQYSFYAQGGSPTPQLTPQGYAQGHSSPQGYSAGDYNTSGAQYAYNGSPGQYSGTPASGYFGQQHVPQAAWPEAYSGGYSMQGHSAMPAGYNPYGSAAPQGQPPSSSSHSHSHSSHSGTRSCSRCGATSTPLWRREPGTQRSLCNACGLYAQQRHQDRPQALIDSDAADVDEAPVDGPTCTHCGTHRTSVWRRNKKGELVCNACGCYERLNGRPRPLELRTNRIKPRAKQSS